MTKFAAYLIVATLLFTACRKVQNGVTPGTGPAPIVLSGTVSPAESVNQIYVAGINGATSVNVVPDAATGVFKATGLTDGGIYVLRFILASSYKGVTDTIVRLTAGKSMDIGTIRFSSTGIYDVFSYQANGASTRSLHGSATYTAPALAISAKASFAAGGDMVSDVYQVNINLDNVTGPGTYVCQGTATSCLTYQTYTTYLFATTYTWNSINVGGSATVQIKSIDQSANIISGNFSGTLVPA